MDKKQYDSVEMEIVLFDNTDIIATSDPETPVIPGN